MERPRIRDYFQQDLSQNETITPKQRAILQASLDLFAEKGFDQTSTSDIAQRAGVAEGTVYRRYKTKAALRDAILAPITAHIVPILASDFSEDKLRQRYPSLQAFVTAIFTDRVAFAKANVKELKVIFEMAAFDTERREQILSQIAPKMVKQMGSVINQLKADHLIVDWPNDLILQSLLSQLFGYLARLILELPGTEIERQQAYLITVMTKILTPGEHDQITGQ
ncbi:TetR/AcrR family transcriptional regulator [Levilactobacillus brevis]|uniref:TetR/AcrR family transcriptional regulator n=1 Tax=Levilactobacillus brevis TaxID=1580 RepID=UPI0022A9A743|nr:TetR/AcrR family transcriptional regulator [Levilactobacillus brevis]MCZ2126135.1 TetR/AcrR family transcriptional regulator [Levilactobacillus brevis]MCZ2325920.1 TetR/AcrR family transcriptional regulator [Levilactobacillus brevis]